MSKKKRRNVLFVTPGPYADLVIVTSSKTIEPKLTWQSVAICLVLENSYSQAADNA
jgi:hypothetical protein